MTRATLAAACLAAASLAGCSSNSEYVAKLRSAVDQANVKLSDSVQVAEGDANAGVAFKAALLVNADPVFAVDALASVDHNDVRVDILSGAVLSVNVINSPATAPCPGSISLSEAIAIAEGAVGGEAVAIQPDDDDACNREVQVLDSDTLWEVKVSPSGKVIETEESDEDGSED